MGRSWKAQESASQGVDDGLQGSASLGLHKAQGSPPNFPRLIIVQFTGILVCLELNVNGGELLLWGGGRTQKGWGAGTAGTGK